MPKQENLGFLFILTGLAALCGALIIGLLAAVSFGLPSLGLDNFISFRVLRPLHVTLAVGWIWFSAIGAVYLAQNNSNKVQLFHLFWGWILSAFVLWGILTTQFTGREYMEFPVIATPLLLFFWFLFAWQVIPKVASHVPGRPLYLWMWLTGATFMILCLLEASLWLLPHFFENPIRDLVVQWKSYGALIGSWNMLIYGLSTYIGYQQGGEQSRIFSKTAFALYFVGFVNMLFNWGHHTYPLPAAPAIRTTAYLVSMVELVILVKLLRASTGLVSGLKSDQILKLNSNFTEFWVLANLVLAILISIPAINIYTHGTHITVAHAMGATIGINTSILVGAIMFFARDRLGKNILDGKHLFLFTWITHGSLFIFWTTLLLGGAYRIYITTTFPERQHFQIIEDLSPIWVLSILSGLGLLIGLGGTASLLFNRIRRNVF